MSDDQSVAYLCPCVGNRTLRCFHVLGFDVLLDASGNPHLLEINSNPSLNINHEARDEATGKMRTEVWVLRHPLDLAALFIPFSQAAQGPGRVRR